MHCTRSSVTQAPHRNATNALFDVEQNVSAGHWRRVTQLNVIDAVNKNVRGSPRKAAMVNAVLRT